MIALTDKNYYVLKLVATSKIINFSLFTQKCCREGTKKCVDTK